jgi:hypothetical protein
MVINSQSSLKHLGWASKVNRERGDVPIWQHDFFTLDFIFVYSHFLIHGCRRNRFQEASQQGAVITPTVT